MTVSHFTSAWVFLFALAAVASAQATKRISVDSGGIEGDAESNSPAMSANARYVAFYSEASNLVPGDTNGADDIFLRDRSTGTTTRVSVDSTGAEGDGDSYFPAISADGRFVAFYSEASNLVPGDTNGVDDVFVFDTVSSITSRVSVDSAGLQGNGRSLYPSLSASGRYVAFQSDATNLVALDTNGQFDVFVHDRATGLTTRVSVSSAGGEANDYSANPAISADGSRVAFESRAGNLVTGDANGFPDIFVRDLVRDLTICASVDPNGVPGDMSCSYPSISGDGRIVAFNSSSRNLVAGDTNERTDVFARNLVTRVTSRVSVSTAGAEGDNNSLVQMSTAMSHDGRFVAFKSPASNLVPGDTNGLQDIFLRDRRLGTTTRVSVDSLGAQALGHCSQPTVSADGRYVGFYSFAQNLVPGDTNGVPDVFVRRLR